MATNRFPTLFLMLSAVMMTPHIQAATEHQAAPMLAPAKQVMTREGWAKVDDDQKASEAIPRDMIVKQFRSAYQKAGEPGIAIFWNRKFDDRLSQWEAVARRSVTGEGSVQGADVFKKQGDVKDHDVLDSAVTSMTGGGQPSGEVVGSYERNVKGGSRILASEYEEVRNDAPTRKGLGESRDFEFGAGYMQPFLSASAKMLDRQAIMRLIERDNAREAGSEMIADYQKVETDSLVGYADFLAEIVFTSDSKADLGMSFMVSVKEVATGRVVAMFKSTGKPPVNKAKDVRYVATANGYEKATADDEPATPEAVGQQLAHETMEALANIWNVPQ